MQKESRNWRFRDTTPRILNREDIEWELDTKRKGETDGEKEREEQREERTERKVWLCPDAFDVFAFA